MNITLIEVASFAAHAHQNQRRKTADAIPYINHPLAVASILTAAGVTDYDILAAALTHDVLEDTKVDAAELELFIGHSALLYVKEVSDDKSLPKQTRKELQIEHANQLTPGARLIKLADKTHNVSTVSDIVDWPLERKLEYVDWAEAVVNAMNLEEYRYTLSILAPRWKQMVEEFHNECQFVREHLKREAQ